MALTDDHQFLGMTFVVIDFETRTPAGRPAEPIEVRAVAGRFTPEGQWRESSRYTALMQPPDDVTITRFDVAQTETAVISGTPAPPHADGHTVAVTVKLARIAYPQLRSHRLNELLRYLDIPTPAHRHRGRSPMPNSPSVCSRPSWPPGPQRASG